jgi:hypothetical protein
MVPISNVGVHSDVIKDDNIEAGVKEWSTRQEAGNT